jgi:hypothetical protein
MVWGIVVGCAALLWYVAASQTRLLPAWARRPGPPARQPATQEGRWQQDLRYLERQLARLHIDPFHTVDRETWSRAVAELSARGPQLSDFEMMVEVMRLVAMVGDAHTKAVPPSTVPYHVYSLSVRWLVDGFYVIDALPEHRDLLGYKLVQVGETNVDQVYDQLVLYVSHETETGLRDDIARYLLCGEMLQSLGLVEDVSGAPLTLEDADGTQVRRQVEAVEGAAYLETLAAEPVMGEVPLYRQRPQEHYWFQALEEGMVYLRLKRSGQMEDLAFRDLCAELMAVLDARPQVRLVVDLRGNGGGDSEVFKPLVKGILDRPHINRRGSLFVLVDRGTYSSAALQTVELTLQTNALLLGESPSSVVDHYGQVASFRLPNSRMRIDYSTKHFPVSRLHRGTLGLEHYLGVMGYAGTRFPMTDADMEPIQVDLAIEPTIDDWLVGDDPVLAAALSYTGEQ